MRFRDIPQFISGGSYQVDVQMEYLIKWIDEMIQNEGLQLCPDFQRGHVWTEEQQIKYIEFVLRGGKSGKVIYLNNPSWHRRSPLTATTILSVWTVCSGSPLSGDS